MAKKFILERFKNLEVVDITARGKGVVKTNEGKVIFVSGVIPGDKISLETFKKRRGYFEANLIEINESSANRVVPECEHFGICGGCKWQNMDYEAQLRFKQKEILHNLKNLSGMSLPPIEKIEGASQVYFYRNKMEYGFSAIGYDRINKTDIDIFTLGFKRRGVWWMGDNLEKDSGLFDALVEDNISAIRKYCEATGLAPWHGPKRVGFFRYFVVRKSYKTNHLLFNLVTTSYDLPKFDLNAFSKLLQDIFKDRFAGLLHSINDETGDRTLATAGTSQLISGEDKIIEELLGLNFEISMKSFFQTNPKSAEKLYAKVIEYALENKEAIDNTIVMDLFCGTGTIGQILASRSTNAKIIGVDIVASAIKDAIQNAKRNNINGLEFYTADVGKFLYEHPQYKNKIRTIILDPSRAGIAPKTLLKIIAINADRIVYVSCNPATQARDTAEMMKYGYEIKKISLVDQFPHTSHIETVVLFEKI